MPTDPVAAVIAEMLAARDDAVTREFATDVYTFPPARRLSMAELYRDSVRAYEFRKREVQGRWRQEASTRPAPT